MKSSSSPIFASLSFTCPVLPISWNICENAWSTVSIIFLSPGCPSSPSSHLVLIACIFSLWMFMTSAPSPTFSCSSLICALHCSSSLSRLFATPRRPMSSRMREISFSSSSISSGKLLKISFSSSVSVSHLLAASSRSRLRISAALNSLWASSSASLNFALSSEHSWRILCTSESIVITLSSHTRPSLRALKLFLASTTTFATLLIL
mmetsp:Transcript_22531/g.54875  ORF Transcript_22531/g.54875 Transcript_22531/m.54875 type:complete len:207 (+) Transcript_22531:3110-3730(+)